jgi:hypothetical protein
VPRRSPDWRIWLGLGLTFAWLLLGSLYVSSNIGWLNLDRIPADEIGNFLEGAFAPLAFLWLVIGYFLQQKELQQNTEALRAQAEQMAESVRHERQDNFLQIARHVRSQLGSISAFLFISSQSVGADGNVTLEEQSSMFARQSAQDPEIFSRRLLEIHVATEDPQARYDLFYKTPVRARHSNNFIRTFERLLRRAEEVDAENILRDALLANGHGMLYSVAKYHQASAPPELADYRQTGTYLQVGNVPPVSATAGNTGETS